MLDFLSNKIIYSYNDMAGLLINGLLVNERAYYTTAQLGIDIHYPASELMIYALRFLFRYVPPILLNNLMLLVLVPINFVVGKFFFSRLIKLSGFRAFDAEPLAVVFSLIYTFSIHFIFRVISLTPSMYASFVFPLLLFLLIKRVKPHLVGFYCFLVLAVFNYYGFFCFVTAFFWYIAGFVIDKERFIYRLKKLLVEELRLISIVLVLVAVIFGRFFWINVPIFGSYKRPDSKSKPSISQSFYRPIENYYSFSFRPWYFIIPPKTSIYFRPLSLWAHTQIENTGYYLAKDYEEDEMAGSYMGWHFLLGAILVSAILLAGKRFQRTFQITVRNEDIIKRCFIVGALVLSISSPPSFTVSGFTIYTPAYIAYYVFPVFRSLTRWSVVLFLLVLVINFILALDLLNILKRNIYKWILVFAILLMSYFLYAVGIPVLDVSSPPPEIAYLKNTGEERFSFAVFPIGDYYSFFWILSHKKFLINPKGYLGKDGFSSDAFSKELVTDEGLLRMKEAGVKYLIFYPDKVTKNQLADAHEKNPNVASIGDINLFFESRLSDGVKFGNGSVIYKVL